MRTVMLKFYTDTVLDALQEIQLDLRSILRLKRRRSPKAHIQHQLDWLQTTAEVGAIYDMDLKRFVSIADIAAAYYRN